MACTHRISGRSWGIHFAAVLAGGLLVIGCRADRTSELKGAWQATLLVEEGDTIDVKLDDVTIAFEGDGDYYYTATLDYKEEGNFRVKGNLLYRTPKGEDPGESLPVEIAFLDAQNLHLNMQEAGKARRLELVRIDPQAIDQKLEDTHADHEYHDHGISIEDSELDSLLGADTLHEHDHEHGDVEEEIID